MRWKSATGTGGKYGPVYVGRLENASGKINTKNKNGKHMYEGKGSNDSAEILSCDQDDRSQQYVR